MMYRGNLSLQTFLTVFYSFKILVGFNRINCIALIPIVPIPIVLIPIVPIPIVPIPVM